MHIRLDHAFFLWDLVHLIPLRLIYIFCKICQSPEVLQGPDLPESKYHHSHHSHFCVQKREEFSGSLPLGFSFSGDATEYSGDIPDNGGRNFMCSYPHLSGWAQQYFVGLNVGQWDEGRNCGRCIKMKCVDSKCKSDTVVVVQVIDMCPGCKDGDLDLALTPWRELTGISPDRLTVAWNFTSCANFVDDTIIVSCNSIAAVVRNMGFSQLSSLLSQIKHRLSITHLSSSSSSSFGAVYTQEWNQQMVAGFLFQQFSVPHCFCEVERRPTRLHKK